MAEIEKEMVMKAISNKDTKYVSVDSLKSSFATVATVEAVAESWVISGHIVARATVYFNDNTFIRTMSKHVVATIAALADDPV